MTTLELIEVLTMPV